MAFDLKHNDVKIFNISAIPVSPWSLVPHVSLQNHQTQTRPCVGLGNNRAQPRLLTLL